MAELPTIQPEGVAAPFDLPVAGGPAERADAARNRERILCAAARLFAEQDAGRVSMDAIAAAAGVGKGTIFRRFGDRAGLMHALLDEERDRLPGARSSAASRRSGRAPRPPSGWRRSAAGGSSCSSATG